MLVVITVALAATTANAIPAGADGTGVTITEFATAPNSQPEGMTAGPDGNVWFTESFGNPPPPGSPAAIGRISTDGSQLTEFPLPTLNSEPHGITVGADGNLWFTERTGNKLGRITVAGVVTEFNVTTPNSYPDIIIRGSDDNLWFTEKLGNRIGRFNPSTHQLDEYVIPTPNSQPHEIVIGPDHKLWFTEVAGNKIGRLNPTSGTFVEYTIPTPESHPFGMTVGPDGNLWFTECGPGTCRPAQSTTMSGVGRLNPSTGQMAEFPTPNARPFGITTGPNGNLWFTEINANAIGEITTAGVVSAQHPVPTPNSFPLEIITGPDGRLWFTEHSATANKVARIEPGPDTTH